MADMPIPEEKMKLFEAQSETKKALGEKPKETPKETPKKPGRLREFLVNLAADLNIKGPLEKFQQMQEEFYKAQEATNAEQKAVEATRKEADQAVEETAVEAQRSIEQQQKIGESMGGEIAKEVKTGETALAQKQQQTVEQTWDQIDSAWDEVFQDVSEQAQLSQSERDWFKEGGSDSSHDLSSLAEKRSEFKPNVDMPSVDERIRRLSAEQDNVLALIQENKKQPWGWERWQEGRKLKSQLDSLSENITALNKAEETGNVEPVVIAPGVYNTGRAGRMERQQSEPVAKAERPTITEIPNDVASLRTLEAQLIQQYDDEYQKMIEIAADPSMMTAEEKKIYKKALKTGSVDEIMAIEPDDQEKRLKAIQGQLNEVRSKIKQEEIKQTEEKSAETPVEQKKDQNENKTNFVSGQEVTVVRSNGTVEKDWKVAVVFYDEAIKENRVKVMKKEGNRMIEKNIKESELVEMNVPAKEKSEQETVSGIVGGEDGGEDIASAANTTETGRVEIVTPITAEKSTGHIRSGAELDEKKIEVEQSMFERKVELKNNFTKIKKEWGNPNNQPAEIQDKYVWNKVFEDMRSENKSIDAALLDKVNETKKKLIEREVKKGIQPDGEHSKQIIGEALRIVVAGEKLVDEILLKEKDNVIPLREEKKAEGAQSEAPQSESKAA